MEAIEQLQEGKPAVGGSGAGGDEPKRPQQGPDDIIEGARRPVCRRSWPAGEPGEGAEGKVLHRAPLRHHARVLEGLASEFIRTYFFRACGPSGAALQRLWPWMALARPCG